MPPTPDLTAVGATLVTATTDVGRLDIGGATSICSGPAPHDPKLGDHVSMAAKGNPPVCARVKLGGVKDYILVRFSI